MSRNRPNNPRAFAHTVAVQAWRTPFEGDQAIADLYIDIVFDEGRIGDDERLADWPVRFRLSLRKAELHVCRDAGEVLRIPPGSVVRAPPRAIKQDRATEKKSKLDMKGNFNASEKGLSGTFAASGQHAVEVTDRIEEIGDDVAMHVQHRPIENGYAFIFSPNVGDRLKGAPWTATEPRMKITDTKASRKRGEPPELTVEVRCLREDLIIEDVQFRDSILTAWDKLSANKRFMVEQYLRQELTEMGFLCGDLSEPFAHLVLADAISTEE